MKLDHVALYVNDLEGSKAFFMKYFDAVPNEKYHNPRTGLMTYFLTFADSGGARLEIMTRPEMADPVRHPFALGWAHLSIKVGSPERLRADGFEIVSEPRTTGDGYYESCFLDKEGNQIELVA